MATTKFNICDKVVWYNTGDKVVMESIIQGIQIIPKAVHQDEEGNPVLDGYAVLYTMKDTGLRLVEGELYATAAECIGAHLAALEALGK